jgi:sulfofructose kinase
VNVFARQGGGPAANAAVAAARLGARAAFVGAVGDDALGLEQIEELAREGVDVSGVERVAGTPSFLSFILVDPADGARTIFSAPADRPLLTSASGALAHGADLLLADGWGGPVQEAIAADARARGIPLLLDAGSSRPEVLDLVKLAEVVIASEAFAEEWLGPSDPAEAVRRLLDEGVVLAAVTRGARGVIAGARGADELFEVGALPAEAVDTTGAGDAFHGGAAFGLASGQGWEASLRLGAFVAARKCEVVGARAGLPTRAAARAAGLLDTPPARS